MELTQLFEVSKQAHHTTCTSLYLKFLHNRTSVRQSEIDEANLPALSQLPTHFILFSDFLYRRQTPLLIFVNLSLRNGMIRNQLIFE